MDKVRPRSYTSWHIGVALASLSWCQAGNELHFSDKAFFKLNHDWITLLPHSLIGRQNEAVKAAFQLRPYYFLLKPFGEPLARLGK